MTTSRGAARDAAVGDDFTSGPRAAGLADWNRYAAVNDEFVPIHMDDEAGRRAGFPGAIGMGRLQWAHVHNLLRAWLAEDGRIVAVAMQYRAPNLKDRPFECRGRVLEIRQCDGELLLDCDVWIEDDTGRVLAPGTATVAVPQR